MFISLRGHTLFINNVGVGTPPRTRQMKQEIFILIQGLQYLLLMDFQGMTCHLMLITSQKNGQN